MCIAATLFSLGLTSGSQRKSQALILALGEILGGGKSSSVTRKAAFPRLST